MKVITTCRITPVSAATQLTTTIRYQNRTNISAATPLTTTAHYHKRHSYLWNIARFCETFTCAKQLRKKSPPQLQPYLLQRRQHQPQYRLHLSQHHSQLPQDAKLTCTTSPASFAHHCISSPSLMKRYPVSSQNTGIAKLSQAHT